MEKYVRFEGDPKVYERIKCGDKDDAFEHQNKTFVCGDCGAAMGEYHDWECNVEKDPRDRKTPLTSSEDPYYFYEDLFDARSDCYAQRGANMYTYSDVDPEAGLFVLAIAAGAGLAYGGYRAIKSTYDAVRDIRAIGGFRICREYAKKYIAEHGIR